MRVAGLFAGIGGLELGLHESGHETILLSENWAPAASVLRARFPDVPNAGDVIRLKSLPTVDLLTAGFPCQDLSQAGKTAGIEGKKSGLVDQVFRLIDSGRPKWVLLENVSFMLRLDRGSAMNRLVSEFEDRGYRWAYRVVNSLSFVPQRRERVFFLASLEGDPADILLVDDAEPVPADTRLDTHAHGFLLDRGNSRSRLGRGFSADFSRMVLRSAFRRRLQFCCPTAKSLPPISTMRNGCRGSLPGWTKPAERVGRSSFRWSLGWQRSDEARGRMDRQAADATGLLRQRERRCRPRNGQLAPRRAARWRNAPRGADFRFSDFKIDGTPLHQFLEIEPQLLSARATAGFLSRIEKSSLRFVPGFKDRVRAHLEHVRAIDRFARGKPETLIAAE